MGASTLERNTQNKLAGEVAASRRTARIIAGLGVAAADEDDDSSEEASRHPQWLRCAVFK